MATLVVTIFDATEDDLTEIDWTLSALTDHIEWSFRWEDD